MGFKGFARTPLRAPFLKSEALLQKSWMRPCRYTYYDLDKTHVSVCNLTANLSSFEYGTHLKWFENADNKYCTME